MKTTQLFSTLLSFSFLASLLFFSSCTPASDPEPQFTAEDLLGTWYIVSETFTDCDEVGNNTVEEFKPVCLDDQCYKAEFTRDELSFYYVEGAFPWFKEERHSSSWQLEDQTIQFCDINISIVDLLSFDFNKICDARISVELEGEELTLTFENAASLFLLGNFDSGCKRVLKMVRAE